ncbi:MAG: SCO family protein [Nitrospirae bacterium]|nr:SCO family protein [Nitrospirota bacterium]
MRTFLNILVGVCIVFLGTPTAAWGHEELPSGPAPQINERVGQSIPLDAQFYDEQGNAVSLKQLVDRPVVLSLVYYGCDRICPQLLGATAAVTGALKYAPGKDYLLITISFDPEDTPKTARDAKKNYINFLGPSFPEGAWRFLTGTDDNIKRVLRAAGYAVRKEDIHGFSHPNALVVISPKGKIVRYVYPVSDNFSLPHPLAFQPFDLTLAIGDAAKEKTGFSIQRALAYCFPHEPKGQKTFFYILKISGAVIIFFVLAFFAYLLSGKKTLKGNK